MIKAVDVPVRTRKLEDVAVRRKATDSGVCPKVEDIAVSPKVEDVAVRPLSPNLPPIPRRKRLPKKPAGVVRELLGELEAIEAVGLSMTDLHGIPHQTCNYRGEDYPAWTRKNLVIFVSEASPALDAPFVERITEKKAFCAREAPHRSTQSKVPLTGRVTREKDIAEFGVSESELADLQSVEVEFSHGTVSSWANMG